jgi:hypothetical protein
LQARVRSNFKLIEKRAAVNNHKLGIECRIWRVNAIQNINLVQVLFELFRQLCLFMRQEIVTECTFLNGFVRGSNRPEYELNFHIYQDAPVADPSCWPSHPVSKATERFRRLQQLY